MHAPELHVPHVPAGGLNLWARLPDTVDAGDLVRACETRGLLIAAGAEWFPAEPSGPFIRLNFASESPDRFAEAGQILGAAIRAAPNLRA
jgi:DNA-binding transcriptional MocR family regulator